MLNAAWLWRAAGKAAVVPHRRPRGEDIPAVDPSSHRTAGAEASQATRALSSVTSPTVDGLPVGPTVRDAIGDLPDLNQYPARLPPVQTEVLV